MKAFTSPGGNLSDFHQTSLAAACSCHYGEMAPVIEEKWRFILRNRTETVQSCQPKPEEPNGNCLRVGLTSAKI